MLTLPAKRTPPYKAAVVFVLSILVLLGVSFLVSGGKQRGEPLFQEASEGTQKVKVFLIAEGDKGKLGETVGCDDSAVPMEREIPRTKAVLKAAIEELLGLKSRYYLDGALYNALYRSGLRLDSVTITEEKAKIELSGGYMFKGVCEDARFMAQLTQTAKQFPTVKEVEIFLNGRSLDDLYR